MKYKNENIFKDIFIDDYKQVDIIKNDINFLRIIDKLKLYIIKFKKDVIIKAKLYFFNYIIGE